MHVLHNFQKTYCRPGHPEKIARHVARSAGLAKAMLQGTVQGGRRRGPQKKSWENNISEWTGLKFCDALREAGNQIKWTERVATCRSMVP